MNDRPTPETCMMIHGVCFQAHSKFAELVDLCQRLEQQRDDLRDDMATINAERSEARSLRQAWIDSDNLRQKLERENAELKELYKLDTDWLKAENAAPKIALRWRIKNFCDRGTCGSLMYGNHSKQ